MCARPFAIDLDRKAKVCDAMVASLHGLTPIGMRLVCDCRERRKSTQSTAGLQRPRGSAPVMGFILGCEAALLAYVDILRHHRDSR